MKINDKSIVLASNGYNGDGNAEAILKYLLDIKASKVFVIKHPLLSNDASEHYIEMYQKGRKKYKKTTRFYHYPPWTYVTDLLFPNFFKPADIWIGFGTLNTFRGILLKKLGLIKMVIYSGIDFTPNRFGKGSFATRIYDFVDKINIKFSDKLWSLAERAHLERLKWLNLDSDSKYNADIVPMGAWLKRINSANVTNFKKKQIVYLGSIIEKQGIQEVLRAIKILKESHQEISLKIIGQGDYLPNLQKIVEELEIEPNVEFLGFIKSHEEVENILSQSTLAVATYKPDIASFTLFTDPGKLKAYLSAGLPIVMTNTTQNSKELADQAGASMVEYSAKDISDKVSQIFSDGEEAWWKKSQDARAYMEKRFDWVYLLDRAFKKL